MLARDSVIYLLARVFPAIFSFATIAILTRALSPREYGSYALIMSAAMISGSLLFSWNNYAVARSYAEFGERRDRLLSTALIGLSASWLIFVIIVIPSLLVLDVNIGLSSLISAAVFSGAFAWMELTGRILNVSERPYAYVGLHFLRSVSVMTAGGGIGLLTGRSDAVIFGIAVSYILVSLLPFFSKWLREVRLRSIDRQLMGQMFRYGFPLAFAVGLMQLVGALDRWMLEWYIGRIKVAEYAVGYDIAQFSIIAIGSSLNLAFYPRIMHVLHHSGKEEADRVLSVYFLTLVSILLPSAVGLAIVADQMSMLLVGDDLRDGAAKIIPWISYAMLFAGLKAFYADYYFQLSRWTFGTTLIAATTLLVNIFLNILLIPSLGEKGAAIASLLTFFIALSFTILLGRYRGSKLPGLTREFTKPIIATAIMAFTVFMLPVPTNIPGVVLKIFVGFLVYATLCWVMDTNRLRSSHALRNILRNPIR